MIDLLAPFLKFNDPRVQYNRYVGFLTETSKYLYAPVHPSFTYDVWEDGKNKKTQGYSVAYHLKDDGTFQAKCFVQKQKLPTMLYGRWELKWKRYSSE